MMLKPLNKRIRVLLLTTFLLIMTTPTLAKNLAQQLISLGLSNPRISISDQEVTLSYIQIRTQMGSFSKELKKTADIIKAISETHLDARLVKLRLTSDNDQITVITGTPNDAASRILILVPPPDNIGTTIAAASEYNLFRSS